MSFDPAKHPRGFHGRFGSGGSGGKKKKAESIIDTAPSAFANHPEHTPAKVASRPLPPMPKGGGYNPRSHKALSSSEIHGASAFGGSRTPAKAAPAKTAAKKAPAKKAASHNPHADFGAGFAQIAAHEDARQKKLGAPAKAAHIPAVVEAPKRGGFRPSKKTANTEILGQYTHSAWGGEGSSHKPVGTSTAGQLRGQRAAIAKAVGAPKKKSARQIMGK